MPFTALLPLEKLDPLPLMGKWYVTAHLPYLLERSAYAAVLTLTWDTASSRVTVETSFADGRFDGAARTVVREGPIDETGRDWRLRQSSRSTQQSGAPPTMLSPRATSQPTTSPARAAACMLGAPP